MVRMIEGRGKTELHRRGERRRDGQGEEGRKEGNVVGEVNGEWKVEHCTKGDERRGRVKRQMKEITNLKNNSIFLF